MTREMLKNQANQPQDEDGFTLVELLVSTAILVLLVAVLLNMVTQTSKTWKSTSGKIEEFRAARDGFDTLTRRLSQATLNTYLDYVTNASGAPPTAYKRESELRFLSGPSANILGTILPTTNLPTMSVFFQAPIGYSTNSTNAILQNALNTLGYFIEYGSDTNILASFLQGKGYKPRYRYRLMELLEPSESLSIYNYTSGNSSYTNIDWIANSMTQTYNNRPAHLLAENIIALIILPHQSPADYTNGYTNSSLAPSYTYDTSLNLNISVPNNQLGTLNTHNQLPPIVQVTLIAVDESSAIRFTNAYSTLASTFTANNWFTNAANYSADLSSCQTYLSSKQINFRVFTTDVIIKGAKWSSSQTN